MLDDLRNAGTSYEPDRATASALTTILVEDDDRVTLLELGSRDEGQVAKLTDQQVEDLGLPTGTAAVAMWRIFDPLEDEEPCETTVATLTAEQHAHVLNNVMSVAIDGLVASADNQDSDAVVGFVERIVTLHKEDRV